MPSGFSPDFFRAVGICPVLLTLKRLGLILLPRTYAASVGLEGEVALRLNRFYQARSLVYFVYPLLVLEGPGKKRQNLTFNKPLTTPAPKLINFFNRLMYLYHTKLF
jgi:hypothetical protein